MKIKLVLSIMAAVLVFPLSGCTAAGKEVPVQATYDEFTQQKNLTRSVTSTRRDTLTVTLPSNPSTGFEWELAGISDTAVLEQSGEPQHVLPESAAPGAAGQEIWTFKPLERGACTIVMEYSQPWQGGAKKEWTIAIEVKIR